MNFEQHLRHHKEVVDREVEGWFYPKDIIIIVGLLQEILKFDGDVCEIGVAYGKSAITLAQFKGNCNFYLYDIFDENIPIVFVYQKDKLYGAAMFKDSKIEVYTTTGRKVTKTTPKVTKGEIDVALKQISLNFPK